MAFVQFSQVSLAFGDRDILKNVSVNLQNGTKAALTGANGAGKSTLIKVMAGISKPDSGQRIVQKNARIGYLPQSGLTHSGSTLLQEADRAFQFGYDMQAEIDHIGDELKTNPPNTPALVERQADLIAELDESGWHRRGAQAESVLLGLGFTREDFAKQTEEFSGGWQMRIALAKVLMQQPDILLLDEPTNYLDIDARSWLEQFLQSYKGGFLLVSHDRYFLDVTINEVYELFNGELKHYAGNFTHYEAVRKVELKTLIAAYEQQQQEIQHLEDFINRFGAKATKAAQAQDRQKQLDKIVRIEIPESLKQIHFTFPPAPHAGKLVLRMNGITKSYDGVQNVIDNLDITLENGERLVVVGHNGAGKSTLLRIIAGEDRNFSGEIIPGAGVQTGYFSQDSAETITGSQNIVDYIESIAPFELIPKVRGILGAFLFRGDDVFKSLNVLSGGEKSRIALLQLLLRPVNLLVLDEPTNHLDMHSKDVLMDALKDFGGTVVFVSHDRGFIEGLATRVLELTPGHFRNFPGDYKYYQERIEAERTGTVGEFSMTTGAPGGAAAVLPGSPAGVSESVQSGGQTSWEEEKRRKADRRRLEKDVERIEQQIDETEKQKKTLEEQMSRPEVYSDGGKCRQIQKTVSELELKLDGLNAQWEDAAAKIQ
ncbi:MAG: ABC-F family ATP-binding cassette domain-containing protein [Treponema sp.]